MILVPLLNPKFAIVPAEKCANCGFATCHTHPWSAVGRSPPDPTAIECAISPAALPKAEMRSRRLARALCASSGLARRTK